MDAPWRMRHAFAAVAAFAVLVLPTPAVAAVEGACDDAATCATDEGDEAQPTVDRTGDATEGQAATPARTPRTASLDVEVTPVIGTGPDDGQLRRDEETGLPTLTFDPGRPAEQQAVHEYVVTNTGDVELHDIAVTDDRAGIVLAAEDGTVLPPGEQVVVRAAAVLTRAEAIAGRAGLLEGRVVATGVDPEGATVTDEATAPLQVVVVLATPTADVTLEVLETADVVLGPGGLPTVTWSEEDVAADVEREVRLQLTVVNTGAMALQDLAATVDLDGVVVDVELGTDTLGPGEELTTELVRRLRPGDVTGVGESGPVERDLVATVTVTGTDTDLQPLTAAAEATVLGLVALPVADTVLPAAGAPPVVPRLGLPALLFLALGSVLLLVTSPRRHLVHG